MRSGRMSLTRLITRVCLVSLAIALLSGRASAHGGRPACVDIAEQTSNVYLARLRVPPSVEVDDYPTIAWPSACKVLRRELHSEPPAPNETSLVRCAGGLDGQRIGIRYPLFNPSLATLYRLSEIGNPARTQVLAPDQPDWIVPREPAAREVVLGYLKLGIEHIWTGFDHLLFVAGLLILARTKRRVLLAITGFTLAHSVTLSASVLGWVQLPAPPV